MEQSVTFDFDFYRFTGKGERPTLVSTPHQAHFMRSRYSVDQQPVDAATGKVMKWTMARDSGECQGAASLGWGRGCVGGL